MNKRLQLCIPTLLGTESIVANEVRNLGYETTEVVDGRVTFEGDAEAICIANINLRCAERVMIKMAEFKATSFEMLFENVKAIEWEGYIGKDCAFPVKGHSLKSALHSVPDCQSIIKKAVVSRLSEKYGIEWFEETGPLYPIQFAIMKDIVTIYIDTTGENLYKRGYRQKGVVAPMRETLAYAMIDISRWQGDRPFMDPFCGSGTFPIEAAMLAANIAPGMNRSFTAEKWTNFIDKKLWYDAIDEANDIMDDTVEVDIQGFDIDPAMVRIARQNAKDAGVDHMIHFQQRAVADLRHPKKYGFVITNPPYGERIEEKENLPKLYREIGEAYAKLDSWSMYMITSYEDAEKYIGRKADKNRKIYNGMMKTYLYQFMGPKPPKGNKNS